MNSHKANFLGIGAQKCASTWIHRVLEDHPQVKVSTPKELDFFSYYYNHGFQWYERHFEESEPCLVRGEISTSYFYDWFAPERAAEYNPDFRLIVSLRDPVDRAYSNHLHEIRIGHYIGPDLGFEAGLAQNPMYIEQSRYWKQFQHWLQFFPKERFLVLIQEEIMADPTYAVHQLYEFLI